MAIFDSENEFCSLKLDSNFIHRVNVKKCIKFDEISINLSQDYRSESEE